MFKRFKGCLPALTLGSVLACLVVHSTWAADEDFLRLAEAAKRKDTATLAQNAALLQGSLLAPYADYFLLNNDLATQPVEAILAFANKNPDSALTEKLLADYAEEQAKVANYSAVRRVAPIVINPDLSESCAIASGQLDGHDVIAASSLMQQTWLATEKVPELCQMFNQQVAGTALVNADLLKRRLWLLLRTNQPLLASEIAQRMGLSLNAEQLAQVGANPDATVMLPVSDETSQALFLYALARLAERSPEAANQILMARAQTLPQNARRYAYRIVALSATGKYEVNNGFDSRVVDWFDQSRGFAFSDEEAENYARHAVRFGRWESVLSALDAMSVTTQKKRDWQYWFARASEQRGTPQAQSVARTFYQSLANNTDYYGLLARDRLGIKTPSLESTGHSSSSDKQRLAQNVNFQRAFLLRRIGAEASYATREWNWAVRRSLANQDAGMVLAAAEQADQMGWYDRAIYALERPLPVTNPSIRFPMPHRSEVVSYSQQVGIDPAWAYGLMRQESRFVTSARSNVGAGGLMQIMPDTGKWIAKRLGERYSADKLSSMDSNIRYGTYYLSHIQQQLSNQPVLATAGYNAGPRRASRWQPQSSSLAADQYTESIPFTETRDYVKNVMTNAVHYALLLGQGPQSLGARMGTIPMQGASGIEGP